MKQKKLWIIIAVAAVLVIGLTAGILVAVLGNRDPAYRTVKVYQVDGTAEIYRGQGDPIAAYQNMLLENMDSVKTLADSYLYVKLDDDKYLMATPNAAFRLEAEGDAQNSKTRIVLESGEIFVHVTDPLSDASEFKVNTGNSTMAIRGTSFSVSCSDGNTHYNAFDGTLEITPVDQSGNAVGEAVTLTENTSTTVTGTDEVEVAPAQPVDYEALNGAELEFLKYGIEQGNEMDGIDASEIESMLGTTEQPSDESSDESSDQTTEEPTTEEPTTEEPTTEEPTTEEPTTEEPTTEEPAKPVYKVTFEVDGSVFAIQEVREGEKATKPWLKPNPYGFWDWDFEQPITEDTVIYWQIDFAE